MAANFESNHSPHAKRGTIQCLHSRASTICEHQQELLNKTDNFRCNLQLSGNPQWFTNSVHYSKDSRNPDKEKSLLALCLCAMCRAFPKSSNVGGIVITSGLSSKQNILLQLTCKSQTSKKNLQQAAPLVHNIPYVCGRSYDGETSRLPATQLQHKQNLRDRLSEKSKLDHPAIQVRLG